MNAYVAILRDVQQSVLLTIDMGDLHNLAQTSQGLAAAAHGVQLCIYVSCTYMVGSQQMCQVSHLLFAAMQLERMELTSQL